MTQRRNEQNEPPDGPADPAIPCCEEKQTGHNTAYEAMKPGGHRIKDMATVQLTTGDQIERSNKQPDPRGQKDGVTGGQFY